MPSSGFFVEMHREIANQWQKQTGLKSRQDHAAIKEDFHTDDPESNEEDQTRDWILTQSFNYKIRVYLFFFNKVVWKEL